MPQAKTSYAITLPLALTLMASGMIIKMFSTETMIPCNECASCATSPFASVTISDPYLNRYTSPRHLMTDGGGLHFGAIWQNEV